MEQHTCFLCPRGCGANRAGNQIGLCGMGAAPKVARAAAHFWEEPCLSGTRGSGTVFFSGCALGCVFCQNQVISHDGFGREVSEEELAAIFLRLQAEGVHNLNLVTGTHFYPAIQRALDQARNKGFALPVVWNTSGYETEEAVATLAKDVDIWLADIKFFSPGLSKTAANTPDYFSVASRAVLKMAGLAGCPVHDIHGLLQKGLMLRILILPGHKEDAKRLLDWLADTLPKGSFILSLMSQYTPPPALTLNAPLNRRLSSFEYKDVVDHAFSLGLDGYMQERNSAKVEYIPPFDLTGI